MTDQLYKIDVTGKRVPLTDADVADLSALRESVANAPLPVPVSISDRQFAHALWKRDIISLAEAKAFVKVGELPSNLAAIVAELPAAIRDDVDLLLSGATEFDRANPFVLRIASAFGWGEDETDDFWRFAATL